MDSISEFFKSALFFVVATFGINVSTEEPAYQILEQIDPQTEIRLYAPRLAAEVTVAQSGDQKMENRAFGKLAAYIFGDNQVKARIEMTAPVEQSRPTQAAKIAMTAPVDVKKDGPSMTMRFFMPSDYKPDTLPQPKDPSIKITLLPEQRIAVRRYTGFTDEDSVHVQQEKLADSLNKTTWRMDGDFRSYFYNPPWTLPFLRRNEILVPVKQ